MKFFRSILILGILSLLLAEEDPMGSMTIEYGGHDIIELGKAYTKQQYVDQNYYENVIEFVQAGNQLSKRGEFSEAILRFQHALDNDSTYIFAHNGLGNAYLKLNDLDKAEKYFKKAIKFGPTYAFPYNNLANLYLMKGEKDKARSNLETALKYDPNSAYINYNLGNIYLKNDDPTMAQYYFNKAVDKDPGFCNARYNLAIAYKHMKWDGKAIAEYKELVDICPGHAKGVLNLAAYYIQSNKVEQALVLYRQAVIINPDTELYLALGHAYHNAGYNQKEIEAYRSAVNSDSSNIDAKYYLALAYYEQDMIFSSKQLIDEILLTNPDDSKTLELKKKINL
ncbi:MAG: tetratricopeptide repeat protein [Candidatus Marinimicrobia bacterium]|nr:tetratricopeptide repeat protein [Candidatus Neomarinimicrobiota bacterium]